MKKIKLGLFGGSGKMGRAVEQTVSQFQELEPFLFVGKDTSSVFSVSVPNLENTEDVILADVDVWIDFTSGEGLLKLLKSTEAQKAAIVSGSTGFAEGELKHVQALAKKRPVFWASNMSPGLWAFRQALKGLESIPYFDFAIEEIHHTQKKDNPSGTAKTLHSDLEKVVNKKIAAPVGYRLGGVFGIHTVMGASTNEVITLQHQALNRNVFAEGALKAACIMAGKKPGFYSMDDIFSVKN
jgi:4-hydroxy-tetrahydrodipicolinate reductase